MFKILKQASPLHWGIFYSLMVVWLIFSAVNSYHDRSSTISIAQKCMSRKKIEKSGLEKQVYDMNSGSMVDLDPYYIDECLAEIRSDEASSRFQAFLLVPSIIVAGAVLQLIARHQNKKIQQEEERRNSDLNRHQQLRDAIDSQQKMEIIMGDVFKDIQNSTVIHKSVLIDSYVVTSTTNPELANSLASIAKIVAESKNSDAGEHLNRITGELKGGRPNKSLLLTYWNGLKEILPIFKSGLDAATSFEKLIHNM